MVCGSSAAVARTSTVSTVSTVWAAATVWLVVAGTVVVLLALSTRALVPSRPLGRDAPADVFSEGRARAVVAALAQDIGQRVNGTAGYRKAVATLAAELGTIPGVEVQVQHGTGTNFHRFAPWVPFVFRTTNVLGRLPGRSNDAILLDAHFDTLTDSVGAADDAAGVACVVEVLRVLARQAPLDRTIIVNLNGGEERGGLGALAFLDHPWAKQVRAYVYLEALPGGRAVLIGSGPGQPWLARAYAEAASPPLGNIIAQELREADVLPFDGDFTPFHKAGLVGLDVAMVGDAWGLHTELDRLDRLEAGGLQHMGEATLAATRALVDARVSLARDPRPVVYYDLLGTTMLVYSLTAARWLGALALLLFVTTMVWARRQRRISLRQLLGALAWNGLGLVAAILAAVLAALLLRMVHRSHGWFSLPILVVAGFGLPALAAFIAVQAWWRRRALRTSEVERVATTASTAALVFWALLLLLATVRGVASGYVAFHWVLFGTLALVASLACPRLRVGALVLGFIPGAVATIEVATLLIANVVPMTGLFPAEVPTDVVLAVLTAVVTGLVGVVACTIPCRTGGMGKAALVATVLAVAGVIVTAAHPAYSAGRPKRVLVAQAADGAKSALLLASSGLQGMTPLLSSLPGIALAPASWPRADLTSQPFTHMLPAPAPAMAAPTVEVRASSYDPASDARTVDLHLAGSSPALRLLIPRQALLGWSASKALPSLPVSEDRYLINFEGVEEGGDEGGVDFQVVLRGTRPVDIELRGIDGAPATGPEIDAVRRQLPDWATMHALAFRVSHQAI